MADPVSPTHQVPSTEKETYEEYEDPEQKASDTGSGSSTFKDENDHKAAHGEKPGFPGGCCNLGPREKEGTGKILPDGRQEIDEDEHADALGFAFTERKKWTLLTVIFIVQTSMNFNASVIGNALTPMSEYFGTSTEYTVTAQGAFLIAYGFGCEFWAPFSEEFGRWPTLQISLGLVNIWSLGAALSPNFPAVIAFRILGGLSSAGGSVTLGMVADLYQADEQQWAVLFVVLSSVGGSVLGPIVGGFIEQYTDTWRWNFWIQLIFGGATQILHFFLVPETRATVMLDKRARKLRKENPEKYGNVYGPNEVKEKRLEGKELLKVWFRPFKFFLTEPIVLCLSLLSGFSDALIFTFLATFGPVYKQWGFNTYQVGLSFVPIAIGYFLAYFSFMPDIVAQKRLRKRIGSENVRPERRLLVLLYEAPLEAIGLFGFAFTSYGPLVLKGTNTWIAPMIFSTLVGIANFSIYYATIDYMVASYGPYSASATGGNGFARDVLAGIAAFYSNPMFGIDLAPGINPPYNLEFGSLVLAIIAIVVAIPIYVFYRKGEWFRERSKFAQTLNTAQAAAGGRRRSSVVGY